MQVELNSYLDKDIFGMNLAISVSLSSKDPHTKVGAVILDDKKRVVSLGYNGFPSGYPDTVENWSRPKKYDIVIHAEMNALLNKPKEIPLGSVLYTTLYPCVNCAKHICASGIKRVVYWKEHPGSEKDKVNELMDNSGVFIRQLDFDLDYVLNFIKEKHGV